MSKTNIIPAGYRFTFNSYEGDGDNLKTIVKQGVSENEAHLLAKIANLMVGSGIWLENQDDPSEKEKRKAYNLLWPVFEQHKDLFDSETLELFKEGVDSMADYICENIVDYPEDEYYMRVLESYHAEYTPVAIELTDVTLDFLKLN